MSLLSRDVVPSTVVTSTDHGAIAKVAAAFCTSMTLTFLCTRFLIRWPWRQLLGIDDAMTCVATVSGIIQMVLVFSAVSAGFGKMPGLLSSGEEIKADKLIYASDFVYVLTMYLSRLAVICFFFRLEKSRDISLFAKLLGAACAILAPVSLIVIATQHIADPGWTLPNASNAASIWARWASVEILGDILDIAIMIYPIHLVYDLHMRLSTKVKVVLGIFFRFPIIAISIIRLISLSHSLHNPAYHFAYVQTEVLTQVEQAFTLISATVPTMRIFLQAAKSSLLGETVHTQTAGSYANLGYYGQNSGNGNRSGGRGEGSKGSGRGGFFSSGNSGTRDASQRANSVAIELYSRATGETVTRVTHGGDKAGSMASDASERGIVMRQTVDVEVDGASMRKAASSTQLELS